LIRRPRADGLVLPLLIDSLLLATFKHIEIAVKTEERKLLLGGRLAAEYCAGILLTALFKNCENWQTVKREIRV